MNSVHNYEIVSRYFDGKWHEETIEVENVSYEAAGRVAIKQAKYLDSIYGDSCQWRVNIYNPDKRELGSYYELFHGRTS